MEGGYGNTYKFHGTHVATCVSQALLTLQTRDKFKKYVIPLNAIISQMRYIRSTELKDDRMENYGAYIGFISK